MIPAQTVPIREKILWGVLGLLSFLPFIWAAPLFDWDEINFAENAREMIVTGNYFQVQINFEPFWEKPPLFIWMQVISMKLFGINEFAARFPNVIIGAFTLISLVNVGTRFRNLAFGRLAATFFFISLLPHLYTKSGIIDPTFNLFIFMGLFHLIQFDAGRDGNLPQNRKHPWLAGMWIGLATLTKGPVALLVTLLVYGLYRAIWHRFRIQWLDAGKFLLVFAAVILAWFGSILLFTEDGAEIIRKFIVYQAELFSQPVAGHKQPFYYHFVVFLVGCFPMAAFTFRGMAEKPTQPASLQLKRYMLIWWWVIMILFSITTTKIVHYSSMTYIPGAFLAAFFFQRIMEEKQKLKWDNWLLYGLGVLVFGIGVSAINVVVKTLLANREQIKDVFFRENLTAEVHWSGWEFLPAAIFAAVGIAGIMLLAQRKYRRFIQFFMVATPVYLIGLNALVVPKIAQYTQGGAVHFFQSKAGQDCYLKAEGYKSYAQYFYGQIQPFPHSEIPPADREQWMYNGPVDKPVFMCIRINNLIRMGDNFQGWFPQFHEIGRESGFVFFRRDPQP